MGGEVRALAFPSGKAMGVCMADKDRADYLRGLSAAAAGLLDCVVNGGNWSPVAGGGQVLLAGLRGEGLRFLGGLGLWRGLELKGEKVDEGLRGCHGEVSFFSNDGVNGGINDVFMRPITHILPKSSPACNNFLRTYGVLFGLNALAKGC